MRHTRQGARSTREKIQVLQTSAYGTTINIPSKTDYNICVKITDRKHTIYNDQTDKFPVTSRRGHKYLMIICEVDINSILEDPMKTKTEK